MLYMVTWEFIDNSEAGIRGSLNAFQKWQPAAGGQFIGFYGYADGSGGIAIVEVDSHATLAKLTAPFVPWMRFSARPILPIQEAAGIGGEFAAWRATIAG